MTALEQTPADEKIRTCSIATGKIAAPLMQKLANAAMEKFKGLDCKVYPIQNDFFGETITVTGLLTGTDLVAQLKDKALGKHLLINGNMLRAPRTGDPQTDVFLDDVTLYDLSERLHTPITVTEDAGEDLLSAMLTI